MYMAPNQRTKASKRSMVGDARVRRVFQTVQQTMAPTIEDARARESIIDAMCSGQGSRIAQEACDLICAGKHTILRSVCQECSYLCRPEHAMAMVMFLTRKARTGKKHVKEEVAWIADGLATVAAGARMLSGNRGAPLPPRNSSGQTGQRHHEKIRSFIAQIEAASARVGDASRVERGAREDARFAEALGALPAKPGDKWTPVVNLIDVAYRHNVVQKPMVRNDKFRKLLFDAKIADRTGRSETPKAQPHQDDL